VKRFASRYGRFKHFLPPIGFGTIAPFDRLKKRRARRRRLRHLGGFAVDRLARSSPTETNQMATAFVQQNAEAARLWECKKCHRLIAAVENVAYHLVDRVLYGWCETCFILEKQPRQTSLN
jgi:hypothetical protein